MNIPLPRTGRIWLAATTGLLIVGLWKGINLITLLASFLIVLLLGNFLLARRQLRRLSAVRALPEAIFAATPAPISIELFLDQRRPRQGLTLREEHPLCEWFLGELPGRHLHVLSHDAVFKRRGRYRLGPLSALSGHPFGLVEAGCELIPVQDVIVFPKVVAIRRSALRRFLQRQSPSAGQQRTTPQRHPAAHTDFHGLRPYQPGDNTRAIHWRTSAHRGELMVREYEESPTDHLILLVDANNSDPRLLEQTLALAASIVWEWRRQKGDRLVLGIAGATATVRVGNTGRELAQDLLTLLALEAGSETISGDALAEELSRVSLPQASVLLVSPGPCDWVADLEARLARPIAILQAADDLAEFFEGDGPIQ